MQMRQIVGFFFEPEGFPIHYYSFNSVVKKALFLAERAPLSTIRPTHALTFQRQIHIVKIIRTAQSMHKHKPPSPESSKGV